MTIDDLKKNELIVLECLSGSKAYGLDTPASDTDIKGVFILPKKEFYAREYIPQISNPTNDIVYYELGRYLELLSVNNPNILELLNTPEKAILYKHPFMQEIQSEIFLSKLCKDTFGKFALAQIKKAKGLNKKIVNPMKKERKPVLSFCYVNFEKGTLSLSDFLTNRNWKPEDCGLVKLTHMKDLYGLYHGKNLGYNGIFKTPDSNQVSVSSIPKNENQVAVLYFNKDGYSTYCKEYKEYWDWVKDRNEDRYQNTKSHGKNYDAKNMMHTFRLLEMAIEIGRDHEVNVRRPNRDFLLDIKSGQYEYEELLRMAAERKNEMEAIFEASSLPEAPDREKIKELSFQLRKRFYG